MQNTHLLVVSHGSRRGIANEEVRLFVSQYAAHVGYALSLCFVELTEPSLESALSGLKDSYERVVLLPLFLFSSGHVKNDLPLAVAAAQLQFPRVKYSIAEPLGLHPALIDQAVQRVHDAGDQGEVALLMIGRGSSDSDANGDFCKLTRLVQETAGAAFSVVGFMGISKPSAEDALSHAARLRPKQIVVVPYLLTSGVLLQRLQEQCRAFADAYPWIHIDLGEQVGLNAQLFSVLDERSQQALSGARELPCGTCDYRPRPGSLVGKIDGLRALLYSIRHTHTHSRAMPHEHAHANMTRHVLVCGNADCAARGSLHVLGSLRRAIKEGGAGSTIRVTRTSCMGRCGEGPTVAVYPDGVWYRGVDARDADELWVEHLLGDRIVARLVDNIMQ